jgi:NTP pyrophosphatase (non-canonical NTP hydrolase)
VNKKVAEALTILQEECAEVIQNVSKIKRFGLNQAYEDQDTNRIKLQKEVGDVLAMIDILIEHEVLDHVSLLQCKIDKINKLKKFSNLYV